MATKKPTSKTAATASAPGTGETEEAGPAAGAVESAAPETGEAQSALDDDFLFATDDAGNRIADEDSGAAFTQPETLTFQLGKQIQRVEVLAMQVPGRFDEELTVIGTRLALQAGYLPGDVIGPTIGDAATAEGTEGATDERFAQLVQLTSGSEELRGVHAQIAAAATVRDAQGRARTSLPQFRDDLTAEKLLASGMLGDVFISAVMAWWRSIQ